MALNMPDGYGYVTWVFEQTGDPDPWTTGSGFHSDNFGGGDSDISGLVVTFSDVYRDNFNSRMADDITQVRTELLFNDGGTILSRVYSTAIVGVRTQDSIPPNCSTLVSKNTGRAGRKYRGRFFLPGLLAENEVDNLGNIGAGTLSAFQSDVNSFLSDATGSVPLDTYGLVLLHSGSTTPTDLVSLTVKQKIATQRRRLR